MENKKVVTIFILYLVIQMVFTSIFFFIYENHEEYFYSNKLLLEERQEIVISELKKDSAQLTIKIDSLSKIDSLISTSLNCITKLDDEGTKFSLNKVYTLRNHPIINFEISELTKQVLSTRGYTVNFTKKIFELRKGETENPLTKLIYEYDWDLEISNAFIIVKLENEKSKLEEEKNKLINLLNKNEIDKSELKGKKGKDFSNAWNLIDFFYFSFAFMNSGDIMPNNTIIRAIVILQRLAELILLFLLINIKKRRTSAKYNP